LSTVFSYQITTNPIINSPSLVNPALLEDDEGKVTAVSIATNCIQTGMYNSLEDIKQALQTAKIVFTIGDLDEWSYLELGIASSLGKTIYVVSQNKKLSAEDLKIYIKGIDLVFLDTDAFIELVESVYEE